MTAEGGEGRARRERGVRRAFRLRTKFREIGAIRASYARRHPLGVYSMTSAHLMDPMTPITAAELLAVTLVVMSLVIGAAAGILVACRVGRAGKRPASRRRHRAVRTGSHARS